MGTMIVKRYEGEWDFVSVWKTDNLSAGSTGSNQVRIPFENENINAIVYWGDGDSTHVTNTSGQVLNVNDITHTYASPGTYTIRIRGDGSIWFFGGFTTNGVDCKKLISVKNWGKSLKLSENTINPGTFWGCSNCIFEAQDIPVNHRTLAYGGLFRDCSSMTQVPRLNEWDTSLSTSFSTTFFGCLNFNQNINSWDTSMCTRMSYMFYNCPKFNQPLNNFNTSSVTNMTQTFSGCTSFNQDISGWDLGSVSNASSMLSLCSSFNQNLTNWNVSNAASLVNMLYNVGATTVNSTDFSQWDVSNVTSGFGIFTNRAIPTTNYSNMLIAWSQLPLNSNISADFRLSKYNSGAAATARQYIIDTFNWTITDGGQA